MYQEKGGGERNKKGNNSGFYETLAAFWAFSRGVLSSNEDKLWQLKTKHPEKLNKSDIFHGSQMHLLSQVAKMINFKVQTHYFSWKLELLLSSYDQN